MHRQIVLHYIYNVHSKIRGLTKDLHEHEAIDNKKALVPS
jgi:hypothetical protein